MTMPSLDDQCLSTSSLIMQCVLEKEHWQAFGYRKRPRRGKYFDVFISAKKLELETVLLREFWAASFSRVFCWTLNQRQFQYRIEFIARLIDFCIDGISRPLWSSFSFTTVDDAIIFLVDSCQDYGNIDLKEHVKVFLKRCRSHLSQDLPVQWRIGSAYLFINPNTLLCRIIPSLNITGVAKNPHSDIEIRKNKYLEISRQLYNQLDR